MKYPIALVLLIAQATCSRADITVTPWTPLYKGIDHAIGSNCPPTVVVNNGVSFTDSTLQVAHCVRVDLTDPDIRLFTTPRASSWAAESRETLSLSINSFVRNYKVQVAADANFYDVFPGGSDPTQEGLPSEVHGFLMCTGQVVSPFDNQNRYASILFTSNNVPTINLNTRPPGIDTSAIYTAVTGFYPVLTNGVNVWNLYLGTYSSLYSDSSIHGYQPRTVFGISQDRRYLYLMTIDGRQSGNGGGACGNPATCSNYSNGALDAESAMWMLLFGGWDAVSMDGGGSTALYMANCAGDAIGLNHSSYLCQSGRERILGCHFGVYAKPLSLGGINNLVISPSESTATFTWQTDAPSDARIDYGTTPSYGATISSTTRLKNHVFTLNGLSPATTYFYRVSSLNGSLVSACSFTTATLGGGTQTQLFGILHTWKYTSNNLDGVSWQLPAYDDSSWLGPSAGNFYIENNAGVPSKTTPLPYSANNTGTPAPGISVSPTYYFRTHFSFSGNASGVTLNFACYLDDGAVFYLNGTEIQRVRMTPAPAAITYNSSVDPPTVGPCGTGNDATCQDLFSISGSLVSTNLHSGDNLLAAELHQTYLVPPGVSIDAVFGATLSYSSVQLNPPRLNVLRESDTTTVYWNASGFNLQYADDPAGPWADVPGPVTQSTFVLTSPPGMKFYRLRN